ncbi:MAG: hypothetical protein IPN79_18220 [Saprospiraceae bacterium]|nr:hypothetical protein [Saprospiraceae bacterium]
MQKFILFLALAMSSTFVNAQENFSQKVKEIAKEIVNVKKEEKEILKEEVDAINEKVANNEITSEEGDKRKEAAAERSAERIEERIEVLEEQLESLVENAVEETFDEDSDENKVYDEETGDLKINIKPKKQKKNKGEPRTTSQAVFAISANTLIEDHDFSTIDNNKFQLSNARAYEFGFSYKTRVFSKTNFLHLKYGLSLRVNNVRPNENQFFVKNGEVTSLMTDTREYTKDAYFRTTQWVVPLYLEFDFTKPVKKDDEIKFSTQKTFRLGVGGYAGVNSRTKQVVHYTDDKIKYEEEARGNFNVNNFVYGLGAYIGYRDVSLYGKLDLNDLFSEESIAYNNLSVGLRWDFN